MCGLNYLQKIREKNIPKIKSISFQHLNIFLPGKILQLFEKEDAYNNYFDSELA